MSKRFFAAAFATGLLVLAWVAWGFIGTSWLPLAMTAVIAGVYLLGAHELRQYRAASTALAAALQQTTEAPGNLPQWLEQLPASLRGAVRLRVEGERTALPGPALTPYLVGLLVMLGMLGTFLGMVVTFKGAVFALEGSTDLQAIRSALAEPIRGLGLSFGTSVAGVAASAMLGLMSAIARRERMEVARLLDARIAGVLLPFSLVHQRQEGLRALQLQAHALPEVVARLDALMERIDRRGRELDERLAGQQAAFHQQAGVAYRELASDVGASLKDSLGAAAAAAGETIRPVVASAMAQVVQESLRSQERMEALARGQVDALSTRFAASAHDVAGAWTAALAAHERSTGAAAQQLHATLGAFTDTFGERSAALLAAVDQSLARTRAEQAAAEQERLRQWSAALEQMAATLQAQWQRAADEALARQQAVARTLEQTAEEVAAQAGTQALRTLDDVRRLVDASEQLVQSRAQAEARWTTEQGERMDQLAALWRTELGALRAQEDARGAQAVQRLGELQAAVAQHLTTLGAALEAPITRLLQTAAEVPQAAAGVIGQLREEMGRVAERDNLALQERARLLEQLGTLLQAVNEASGQQRAAIDALVESAGSVMQQAASRFGEALDAQAVHAADTTAHIAAGAVELASVAEAFSQGVQLFQASNEKLVDNLQRVEASLTRSTARSDEQLAYYVAQAREVIDLSIASHHGVVEQLRQLQPRPLAVADEAGA